ncbi:MAG: stage V sporulation protein AA [Peptostreptococcaceae bacterium]|nr:stage V sporulation protein AA [Peptostreptococcaceae bacterium]
MDDIYLIPKKIKPFKVNIKEIYLKDIYAVYPKDKESLLDNIILRNYKNNNLKYDVIHLGEVIEKINKKLPMVKINFLKADDTVIFFDSCKKDRTKYIRVAIVSIVVLMGSVMGIMNFHADVNMYASQYKIVDVLTRDAKRYLPYFQIPYSIGIGVGVALFFNKFIPTYSKYEPSPMELKMISLNKEIENQLRGKDQ